MLKSTDTVRVDVHGPIAWLTLDNPPVNLLDAALFRDLGALIAAVRASPDVSVMVLQSADPDVFIAHADFAFALDPSSFAALKPPAGGDARLNAMQQLTLAIHDLPQVTIAKVSGVARGGGNEIAMACDLRFAARGKASFSQVETLLAVMPGGGGVQYLARRIGAARALEAVLSAQPVDAETADRWGWINRVVDAPLLDAFVASLAERIASLPPALIAAVKGAVRAAGEPLTDGLARENELLGSVYPNQPAVDIARRAMAAGAQTPAGERHLEELLARVAEQARSD